MNKGVIKAYYGDHRIVFLSNTDSNHLLDGKKVPFAEFNRHLNFNTLKENYVIICDNPEDDFKTFSHNFLLIEAAGGLIKNDAGKYLFIYRHNKWDLPKGKLDKGEKPPKAAVRECREECGIDKIDLGDFLTHTYHIYLFKDQWALKKTYWYHMCSNQKKLVPQLEESITEVAWKDIEEIPSLLKNSYFTIEDVLEEAGLFHH